MNFSAALRAVLADLIPARASGIAVALSGGADSAALLASLASPRGKSLELPLRAIHVDHGLQSAAADLRASCASLCAQLGVPLEVVEVIVDVHEGDSLEAAARRARYLALAQALRAGECLLTAHHAEDQAETLLLQALRGAGLKGMSAMPALRRLGSGWHLRPLLNFSRHDVLLAGRRLAAVSHEDPMNAEQRFDRNYLRHTVWPLLTSRWPAAAIALTRSARHMAEAQDLIDHTVAKHLERLRDGDCLSVPHLRALTSGERATTVRLWLAEWGLEPPSEARLNEALRQILEADASHVPVVAWGGHALRRYRQRLFVTAAAPAALEGEILWQPARASSVDLGVLGRLRVERVRGGLNQARLPEVCTVRRRRGGETLKASAAARTHSVQHLCQEFGVLPWMRDALPLIFAAEQLIAVGDLWLDARWCVASAEEGLGFVWEDGPVIV